MTLSSREVETLRVKGWKVRAKGRGVRWRMIRDCMSCVSTEWMTSSEVEICMIRIWGLTRKKTRELLEEMVQIGDCLVEKDDKSQEIKYHLAPNRVKFWLGPQGIAGIPAGIAQVVAITKTVSAVEV